MHYCYHALSVGHFDFFSETAERNLPKFDRKQELNVLYQVCVFRTDQNNKMAALASDRLTLFRLPTPLEQLNRV